jgi:uncharacterized protein (UPF0332 family)
MDDRPAQLGQWMALAEQALNTAQANLDARDLRATVNRAYYAVFYSASAVLLTEELERRKHSGLISAFREHLIKPGLIEAEYSNIYGEAMVIREDADYAVQIPVDAEMAETALKQAYRFVRRMGRYLVERGLWNETPE